MYPQAGMRVRVSRGTWKKYDSNGNPVVIAGKHDHVLFCGGNVPVGSEGIIERVRVFPEGHPNDTTMYAIIFDNVRPKGEYCFGIGYEPLPDWLEVLASSGNH